MRSILHPYFLDAAVLILNKLEINNGCYDNKIKGFVYPFRLGIGKIKRQINSNGWCAE